MLLDFARLMIGFEQLAVASAKDVGVEVSDAIGTIDKLVDGFVALLPKLGIAAVVFVFFLILAWAVGRVIPRVLKDRGRSRTNLGKVFTRLAKAVVIFFGLLTSVAIIAPSVTPAKLLGALGFGGVAIGFAFKDILQNYLAGILILLREPFTVGDNVKLGDFEGTVEDIDTRSTEIKTYDGRRVLVPNGQVYTNPMVILTAHEKRRSQYDVGIGYGDDVEEAREAIMSAIKSVDKVSSEPAPDVLVQELAGSSVNLRARWWTGSRDIIGTRDQVISKIKKTLDEKGIDMPYPTQVHLFHDQTEETDGDRTRQREGWPKGDNPPKPRFQRDSRDLREEN